MKIPGLGEVKNQYAYAGFAAVGGIVFYAYYRKRQAANAAAQAATSTDTTSTDLIDPNTGIPYSQEQGGITGFGGVDPSTGIPFVNETGTPQPATSAAYTSNVAWLGDAINNSTSDFGTAYTLAATALGKYIAQDKNGLNPDEYTVVSEIVALMGPPPVGGPYRLIQATGGQNPSPTPVPSPGQNPSPSPSSTSIPVGYHMQDPQVATLNHGVSLIQYWQQHYPGNQQALNNLEQYNPGLNPQDTTHPTMLIRTSEAHLVPNQ